MGKSKGITLIALIITIIILLILAGISIATLTGENGLLSKANIAKGRNKQAEIQEQIKLAVMTARMNEEGIYINLEILEQELTKTYGITEIEKQGENGNLPWKITHEGYIFQIKEDGTVERINGISLNKTTLELVEGESETLIATKGEGIEGKITWNANSSSITVNNEGRITAIEGTTGAITVTAQIEGKEYIATCTVKVVSKVKEISVNDFSIDQYQTKPIIVITNPTENVEKLIYSYTTTSDKVVIDNETGMVTGVTEGNAEITVRAIRRDGAQLTPATFIVTVNKLPEPKLGDFVNYSAGNWTQEDINKLGSLYAGAELPTSSTPQKFGGFKVGQSKDKSITPYKEYENIYSEGWRILKKNDNGTFDIIQAGTTEAFYHPAGVNETNVSVLGLGGGASYSRDWSMYEDEYYAVKNSARMVRSKDFVARDPESGKLISHPCKITGSYYWFPEAATGSLLYYVNSEGATKDTGGGTWAGGIRPVVTLQLGVQLIPKEGQETHDTLETAWQLKK